MATSKRLPVSLGNVKNGWEWQEWQRPRDSPCSFEDMKLIAETWIAQYLIILNQNTKYAEGILFIFFRRMTILRSICMTNHNDKQRNLINLMRYPNSR